jgi:two-component system nitrate/nitrite response regulator NarL
VSARRIGVLIADDHPVYRSGLAEALRSRPEFEVVAEAGDGETALAEIRRLAPAVAVVDLRLPDMDGIAVVEAVEREGLATRLVILSAYSDNAAVSRALAAGARAYLSKICSAKTLCDTLLAVARGDIVIPPGIQAGLGGEPRSRHDRGEASALTARELEVLRLTADGRSAPDIAAALAVSSATVKTHLQHVYEKLGVSDRAAAVARAIRRGLLD